MATLYLMNSPVLPSFGQYQFEGPITTLKARQLVSGGFVSAIGHEGAAALLSELLSQQVEMNRHPICLKAGDKALVLRLSQRLPEGQILSYRELIDIPFELGLLTCLRN